MRDLKTVIDAILAVAPESEDALRYGLHAIQSSLATAAPEMIRQHWQRLYELLVELYPEGPTTEWMNEVQAIFKGEEDAHPQG